MIRSSCRAFSKPARQRPRYATPSFLSTTRTWSLHTRHLSAAANPVSLKIETFHIEAHNDGDLRRIFDSKPFWDEFSSHGVSGLLKRREGLMQNHFLTQPRGFVAFAQDTRSRCQDLVDKILKASSIEEYKILPRQFDLLSDSLCRVLDTADFIRAVHPDSRFQNAASQAYAELWEYMNVLNTTPGLCLQLRHAISKPEVASTWTEEEMTVAKILLRDFSVSAIHLPQKERQEFVELSNDVKKWGQIFVEGMGPRQLYVEFEGKELQGLDPSIVARYSVGRGKVALPSIGEDAHAALCTVHNEDARREIYIAGRQAPKQEVAALETMLRTRAKIAKLSGFNSYAQMSLADKMAGSPEAVNSFLNALSKDNASHVLQELRNLQAIAKEPAPSQLSAWNVLYYQSLTESNLRSRLRLPQSMAAYFSLGTVMQGLSRLFDRLYGVRLVPRPTTPGEVWTPEVRRLDVVHESEGHVAVLYCDLFARGEGKTQNPAHYTLRCSRKVWPDENSELSETANQLNNPVTVTRAGETYQLPTIALVCDFAPPPRGANEPTLLTFSEVQTLFHEMGHAIHSILGRTSLQVVSGTRCPTDFAELPSVLMEYFASDASVLGLFARHWQNDDPLPYSMVEDALRAQKRWQGIQTETQLLNSLLDQAYHSPLGIELAGTDFNSRKMNDYNESISTQIYHTIHSQHAHILEPPPEDQTTPQAFFGHLVEYGGLYYSYLLDKAIAGKIWKQVFRAGRDRGGIDRNAGEKYKNEVLKWGGGRNGWTCVSGVLDDPKLEGGGPDAMREVGLWGVHD